MTTSSPPAEDLAEYIPHAEFRSGLPHGRFRLVVNPHLAREYLVRLLWLRPLVIIVITAGAAFALAGSPWLGGGLVAAGILMNRMVRHGAGRILVHLALRDAAVYGFATSNGILEVQRA